MGSGYEKCRSTLLSVEGHEAKTAETEDHHCPGGGLGNGGGHTVKRFAVTP
jgi:hypothetical protein